MSVIFPLLIRRRVGLPPAGVMRFWCRPEVACSSIQDQHYACSSSLIDIDGHGIGRIGR